MPSNPAKPFLVPRRDDPQLQRVNESIARLAAVRPAGDAFSAFALAAHLADLAIEAGKLRRCCLSASRKSPSSSHGKLAMPDTEVLSPKSGGDEVLICSSMPTTDLTVRLRTKAWLFGIFIRRMIVVMLDANHISERLASLKNEMSELRVRNALYSNQKGYTTLEKSASALRHRRLGEIKLEIGGSDETLCVDGQAHRVAPLSCKTRDRLAFAVL